MKSKSCLTVCLLLTTTGIQAKEWVPEAVRHLHSIGYLMHTLERCEGAEDVDQARRVKLYQDMQTTSSLLCEAAFDGDTAFCEEKISVGRSRVDTSGALGCSYALHAAATKPRQVNSTITPATVPVGVSPDQWLRVTDLTYMLEMLDYCPDYVGEEVQKMSSRRVSHAIDDACDTIPNTPGVCGGAFTAADQNIDALFSTQSKSERETFLTKTCPSMANEAQAIAEKMVEGLTYGEVYRPVRLGSYTRKDMFRAAYLFLNTRGYSDFSSAYELAFEFSQLAPACLYSNEIDWSDDKGDDVYSFWSELAEDLYSEGMLTDDHYEKAKATAERSIRFLEQGDRAYVRGECARIAIGVE